MMKRLKWICVSAALLVVCASCGKLITLKKEVKKLEGTYFLAGELDPGSQTSKTVWAFVWEKQDNGIITIVTVDRLNSAGAFVFSLPAGNRYYVGTLEDANDNERYDSGERLWIYGDPSPVPFKNKRSGVLKIKLSEKVTIPEEDQVALSKAREGRSFYSFKGSGQAQVFIGETARLSDPKFSEQQGEKGLWEPATFLSQNGFGVYFLTVYDPGKIPVLFVYGAGGSPQNWQHIFSKLDDRKYQKWFYYYPSGMRLEIVSNALNQIVKTLHKKYEFSELNVVAHSMGGVVARAFIIKNLIEEGNSYIKKFVTISTPWMGHEAATVGVKRSPAVIPAWIDMQLNSPFIEYIHGRKIGDRLDYYLIFGFHGNRAFALPSSNDGAVSLASELDPRAQREAKKMYGLDKDHMEILSDDGVVETIEGIFMNKP